MEYSFVIDCLVAGILASLACGLGALPLAIRGLNVQKHIGIAYSFAGGLMFSASVYNLLLPAITLRTGHMEIVSVSKTLVGILLGAGFIYFVERYLSNQEDDHELVHHLGGRTGALVFIAMTFHSIPEGVAVGVAYASKAHYEALSYLGAYIAIAIGIHNIPEGLAVALPLRAKGASIKKCFFFGFLTSLPQPLAAVPASILVWLFEPLLLPMFGFEDGAMMYLVIVELIPDSLETHSRSEVASCFMLGFSLMLLVQVCFDSPSPAPM